MTEPGAKRKFRLLTRIVREKCEERYVRKRGYETELEFVENWKNRTESTGSDKYKNLPAGQKTGKISYPLLPEKLFTRK